MKIALRIFLTLLFSMTLFLCLSSVAFAYNVDSGHWGDLEWTLDNEGVLNISGTGKMDDFEFNSSEAWRSRPISIKKVIIDKGITTIGKFSFENCIDLTEVSIPESIQLIGGASFYGCSSLVDLTIPEGVTNIGSDAFENCSRLTCVQIPASVIVIGLLFLVIVIV